MPDVDLDAKWWTLSEAATKNRVTHRVLLTDHVVALLEEARGDAPKESPWKRGTGGSRKFWSRPRCASSRLRESEEGVPRIHSRKVSKSVTFRT
jgi:integrase